MDVEPHYTNLPRDIEYGMLPPVHRQQIDAMATLGKPANQCPHNTLRTATAKMRNHESKVEWPRHVSGFDGRNRPMAEKNGEENTIAHGTLNRE